MKLKYLIISVFLLIILGVSVVIYYGRQVNFNTGYEPDQPIAFSHKIHAGENKINCTYCHFAAEQGRHAGIPPVQLCLNCHSKIRTDSLEVQKVYKALEEGKTIAWTKVNHFPDFAYFNHAQHVNVGKISCQECHGPVESMTRLRQEKDLSMGMCIDCHRQKGIAQPEDHKSAKGGDCASCHY